MKALSLAIQKIWPMLTNRQTDRPKTIGHKKPQILTTSNAKFCMKKNVYESKYLF
jgi:hypothetical protein